MALSLFVKKQITITMDKHSQKGKDFVRDLGETFSDIGQRIGNKFNQIMDDLNTDETATGEAPVAIDVYETTTELVVEAEIPGVAKSDVSLKATGNVLNISGDKKAAQVEGKVSRRRERRFGAFSRMVTLPEEGLKMEEISAKFSDGVLTVRIPKLKPEPPKQQDDEDLTTIDID
jgi:HSP20 family protein